MNDRTRRLLAYLLARLKEPSTYAGLSAVAAVTRHKISNDWVAALVVVGGVIAGLASAAMPELKE